MRPIRKTKPCARCNKPRYHRSLCEYHHLKAAREISLRSYYNNKESKNRRGLRDYHWRRSRAYEVLGNECQNCGYNNWKALQIEHIKGKAQLDSRNTVQKRHMFIINFPIKAKKVYRLWCANCNWIKRYNNRETGIIKYKRLPPHPKQVII